MANFFYRKERPNVFEQRVNMDTSSSGAIYRFASDTVFQAKNVGVKRFLMDGEAIEVISDIGNTLNVTASRSGRFVITEDDMRRHLAARSNDLQCKIVEKLCRDHATSSASSPLISGTAVNNFASAHHYAGYDIRVDLRDRIPIPNPFVSGQEREHFLIGRVIRSDCRSVTVLQRTGPGQGQAVTGPISQIPYPR